MNSGFMKFLLFTVLLASCSGHNRTTVPLTGFENQKEVIYRTEKANYHLGYDDLADYCREMDNGERNRFVYGEVLHYLDSFRAATVIIPDTLGSKIVLENGEYIRIRDQEHPFAHVTEVMEWILLEFARKGNLKVYVNELDSFVDTIVIDQHETNWYGETNLTLTNDSVLLSVLNWIK